MPSLVLLEKEEPNMKKTLALCLAALMLLALCACTVSVNIETDAPAAAAAAPAEAKDSYLITFAHGETYELPAGEDLVFSISCAAPTDMGPPADGEEGAGVTTTSGVISYSNITLGGPNQYPTAETVTISGITEDCTVTITPNPLEDGDFPTVTIGEAAASGSASGEASAG